jgi:hypothetical protein
MLLNMDILVVYVESQMSVMNSVVYSRTLRVRTPCFIWEQMLWKRSANRLRPGGMDVDSGGDILFCGL